MNKLLKFIQRTLRVLKQLPMNLLVLLVWAVSLPLLTLITLRLPRFKVVRKASTQRS